MESPSPVDLVCGGAKGQTFIGGELDLLPVLDITLSSSAQSWNKIVIGVLPRSLLESVDSVCASDAVTEVVRCVDAPPMHLGLTHLGHHASFTAYLQKNHKNQHMKKTLLIYYRCNYKLFPTLDKFVFKVLQLYTREKLKN